MNVNTIAAGAAALVVAASVIAGLYLGGAPAEQRRLRFDEQRVRDLQRISNAIGIHWRRLNVLPGELAELERGTLLPRRPIDPERGDAYDYSVTGPSAYRLCATFSAASPNPPPQYFWNHAAGYQCFEFDLTDSAAAMAFPLPRDIVTP